MKKFLLLSVSLVAMAACGNIDSEVSMGIDNGTFGNATMNNTLLQSGEISATAALSERFNAEVPNTITFEFNSAALTPESQAILDKQANWISQFPEIRFRVYGHTDLVGSNAYNRSLGLRRAQAVVSYFSSRGISPSRVEAVASLGETQPVIATEQPEMRNRRTVTEVRGFVRGHPTPLNGKYAEVIFREYVESGTRPHTPPTVIESQVSPSDE
ncbi:MAG: OmpA family protein [Rhodobacteraceae bacterium]|jgi:peptidoglycan-associated lipoprotein|nr:OmpA family protein [Paracoccaceae bacterium]